MAVECTQTLHQKETIELIKDFFSSVDNVDEVSKKDETERRTNIIGRLFRVTGIKFDKPFIAEVFEGSFTTSSLLKKYPINTSQVMYIFTICKEHYCHNNETYYLAPTHVKSTRVYPNGKVYTDGNNNNLALEDMYFDYFSTNTYFTLNDYNVYRKNGIKTLVLVANKENVVKRYNRKSVLGVEGVLKYNLCYSDLKAKYDNNAYETHRVKIVEKIDDLYRITFRNGTGKIHEYRNKNNFEPFDKSGYSVVTFRKSLINRLESHRRYLKFKRLVETDYSQELQTRYDEIITLKDWVINKRDSETLKTLEHLMDSETLKVIRTLEYLMGEIEYTIRTHENIISKLKRSRELYEEYKHKPYNCYPYNSYPCTIYKKIDDVTEDFEYLDRSITGIRTELFDITREQNI